ncbi:MAG: GspH/FimT family protein [Candidatus Brocadiia bacterium]
MPLPARTTRTAPRGPGGFTLLELSLALLLGGILMAVAAVRLGASGVFRAEGERVARRLVADLRMAHSQAIAERKNHYLEFTGNNTRFTHYAIYRVEAEPDVQVEPVRRLPDSVALTGSAARAEFTPRGDALAAYSYTVASPDRTYTISVTLATGAVCLEES